MVVLYQVDAFTTTAFSGNPAAVCLLQDDLDDAVRQKIAAEMNLSETAFVEIADGETMDFKQATKFKLRWFTPTTEVALCGHATLASAAALKWGEGNPAKQFSFVTRFSGELFVGAIETDLLVLDMPVAIASSQLTCVNQDAMLDALVGKDNRSAVVEVLFNDSLAYALVALKNWACLENLKPAIDQLARLEVKGNLVGVIVTAAAPPGEEKRYDFGSRFFAPWTGISEDPVTGSAHAVLGPYWAQRLGKAQMEARQCSMRGGDLTVNLSAPGRVQVAGHAVIVVKGVLLV
eukprot:jgi/Botrbrau1/5686/Bobra.0071s0022.2